MTSAQVARRLGVGVTAVKRWTDEGLLPCVKTPGGHRRFNASDVERLRLGQLAPDSPDEWGDWIATLVESADVHAVLALLFAERARHTAWFQVATRLGALLEALGERWARGLLSVAQEHVASALLHRALALATETIAVPRDVPRCLLASAEGDDHTLGLALAEICLREAGWRAEWCGSHTRPSDVCERVRAGAVDMVALSASVVMADRRRLRMIIRAIGSVCQRADVPLVFGGSGAWPDPPPFGTLVRAWEDFNSLLRHQTHARVGNHRTGIR